MVIWPASRTEQFRVHTAINLLVHSLSSNGYHAGYVKDLFGCTKKPCECAGFEIKDKTIVGKDCSTDETDFHPLRNIFEFESVLNQMKLNKKILKVNGSIQIKVT